MTTLGLIVLGISVAILALGLSLNLGRLTARVERLEQYVIACWEESRHTQNQVAALQQGVVFHEIGVHRFSNCTVWNNPERGVLVSDAPAPMDDAYLAAAWKEVNEIAPESAE